MNLEAQLWQRKDELEQERAGLLSRTAPLEEAKRRHQAAQEAARLKIADLEAQIGDILGDRMGAICKDLATIGKALSGKSRPS